MPYLCYCVVWLVDGLVLSVCVHGKPALVCVVGVFWCGRAAVNEWVSLCARVCCVLFIKSVGLLVGVVNNGLIIDEWTDAWKGRAGHVNTQGKSSHHSQWAVSRMMAT